MLQSLKKIFSQADTLSVETKSTEDLKLLCGLMLEAANTDGIVDKIEIKKITKSLVEIFGENFEEVELIINDCLKEIDEPKSLHFFTSKINKIFDENKKILLIEVLWKIVLSDGKVHEFESNLIRRLAGLLYISDVSCGNAKNRAIKSLSSGEI